LKSRIAEQCMACDYLFSMEIWLQPKLTIERGQKIMLTQGLASIYEGVLSHILDKKIEEEKVSSSLLDAVIDKEKYDTETRTLGPTLKACTKCGIINEKWSSYLGQIREIRNWVHLTNEKKSPLVSWIDKQGCHDLRLKLDDFRKYIKTNHFK